MATETFHQANRLIAGSMLKRYFSITALHGLFIYAIDTGNELKRLSVKNIHPDRGRINIPK